METIRRWYNSILKKYQSLPATLQFVIGIGLLVILLAGLFFFDSSPYSSDTSTFSLSFGVFLKLIVIILMIYLVAAFYRNWRGLTGKGPVRQLAIKETLHLSPRRALHLVQVGGRQFLIGSTDQNVALISEIKVSDGQADGREPEILSPFSEILASQFQGAESSPSFKDRK
jgi:flagellar biosynthetic protein FliO